MWKYDLSNNTWEHVNGNKTLNIPVSNNYPGGLFGHSIVLDCIDRYLYLFGGYEQGIASSGMFLICFNEIGRTNNLWRYDMIFDTWTFLFGSLYTDTEANYTVPYPSSLYYASMVMDSTDRHLYVFGGYGIKNGGLGTLKLLF